MNQVQSIPNQSQIPKNGQSLGDFSGPGPSNPQNSDRLRADFGPSNPQYRGQPYIGASGVLLQRNEAPGPGNPSFRQSCTPLLIIIRSVSIPVAVTSNLIRSASSLRSPWRAGDMDNLVQIHPELFFPPPFSGIAGSRRPLRSPLRLCPEYRVLLSSRSKYSILLYPE